MKRVGASIGATLPFVTIHVNPCTSGEHEDQRRKKGALGRFFREGSFR